MTIRSPRSFIRTRSGTRTFLGVVCITRIFLQRWKARPADWWPSVSDTVKASFRSRSPFVFEGQLHPGAICRHFAVLDFQIGLYNFGNAQIAQCSSGRLDCISCGILPGFRTRADYLRYFIYGVCSLCLFWHVVSFLLFTLVHSATESRAGLPFESCAGLALRQCFRRDRGLREKLTVSLLKPTRLVGDNTARRFRED